jgi:hypothetical protein
VPSAVSGQVAVVVVDVAGVGDLVTSVVGVGLGGDRVFLYLRQIASRVVGVLGGHIGNRVIPARKTVKGVVAIGGAAFAGHIAVGVIRVELVSTSSISVCTSEDIDEEHVEDGEYNGHADADGHDHPIT